MTGEQAFRFTGETKSNKYGAMLHRIECVAALPEKGVKAGDLGGWLEKAENLEGMHAWVFDEAEVFGNAVVCGEAEVRNTAKIYQDARVSKNAKVTERAKIFGYAHVSGGVVSGKAEVSGHAKVVGGELGGNSELYGNAELYDGRWLFSPWQVQGCVHPICETRLGWLKIGCLDEQPVEELVKNGKFISQEHKYTEAQMQEYLLYVEMYQRVLKMRENVITNPF
jgi:hypothetical protein